MKRSDTEEIVENRRRISEIEGQQEQNLSNVNEENIEFIDETFALESSTTIILS